MAFIRWKPNGAGGRQAYLVHAYRGTDGKPRQKVLAYLGSSTEITPDHLASLREKHPNIFLDLTKIKSRAKPLTDVSTLSDVELLKKMRMLRHERGLNQRHTGWLLEENGLPLCSGAVGHVRLYGRRVGILEKALERSEPQDFFLNPEVELAPVLRKAFSKPS